MRMTQTVGIATAMFVAAALAASSTAIAAVDMFLKLDGIPGESIDGAHAGEIDVLAWSWGASRPGKPECVNVQDISLTKYVDKASAKLIERAATGQPIASAKLTVRKAGGVPLEYIVIEMNNVIVSSLSTGGSGGEDRLTENVSLNFATLKFTYTPAGGTPEVSNISNTCRK